MNCQTFVVNSCVCNAAVLVCLSWLRSALEPRPSHNLRPMLSLSGEWTGCPDPVSRREE